MWKDSPVLRSSVFSSRHYEDTFIVTHQKNYRRLGPEHRDCDGWFIPNGIGYPIHPWHMSANGNP
jgi:hypothetical protein